MSQAVGRLVVPEPADPAQLAKERRVQNEIVGRIVRVKVADGRVFEGRLQCFDNQANLVLAGSSWHRPGQATPPEQCQFEVIIAWKHVAGVELRHEQEQKQEQEAAEKP